MVKNIRPWTLSLVQPTGWASQQAATWLSFPTTAVSHAITPETVSLGPCSASPWSLGDTISWPGQTLGELQKPACHPCTCQQATCSGRKPIFYFFLLWQVSLFLASVPTYPASHTETKKSLHFSSHLSRFLKKVLEFSLQSPVGSCRPPLLYVF